MRAQELQELLQSRLPECEFRVQGDDGQHFQVVAISPVFAEMKTPVKKQQLVMSQLSEEIASNQVHAVALKTFTPEEWEKVKDLHVG